MKETDPAMLLVQKLDAIEKRLASLEHMFETVARHSGLHLESDPDEDKRSYGVDKSHRTFGHMRDPDDA